MNTNLFFERLNILIKEKKQNGLTQEQIADNIGILQSSLSGYINMKKEPTLGNLLHICEYFQISANWILGFEEPIENKPILLYRELSDYKSIDLITELLKREN